MLHDTLIAVGDRIAWHKSEGYSLRNTIEKVFQWSQEQGFQLCQGDIIDQCGLVWETPATSTQLPLYVDAKGTLRSMNIVEFLSTDIPPREMVLAPIIPSQGIVLLFAERGCGKTFAALEIGLAVGAGCSCFGGRWSAPKPQKVVYVDGEMPAQTMQERTAQLLAGLDCEPPGEDYFQIITPDLQDDPMPNLGSKEGQALIEPHLEGVKLLILDNLSTLCSGGEENKAESWVSIQEWLLKLRKAGVSVLMVHHSGKGGQQRGTSKREDILDTSIQMKRPSDYEPDQGAVAEVHLRKARGIIGDDAKPFLANLVGTENGGLLWATSSLDDADLERVRELSGLGMSQREIASELGISQSKVCRISKRIKGEGVIQ